MEVIRKICVAVLIFVLGPTTLAQGDLDLIRRVSENYHNLPSFEIAGHVTAMIPGTELQMRIDTVDAGTGYSSVPEHVAVLKNREAEEFSNVNVTDKNGNPGKVSSLNVAAPNHWGHYDGIAAGIESVKELPWQVVDLEGVSVDCHIFEIV